MIRSLLRPAAFALAIPVLCCAPPASGGYQEGYDAYQARDFARALSEWRPLADRGEVHAQYALGMMARDGQGVAVDGREALRWFTAAAGQGHAASQYELGLLYGGRLGIAADRAQRLFWLNKAAAQNYVPAKILLALLETSDSATPPAPGRRDAETAPPAAEGTAGGRALGPAYDLAGWIVATLLFASLAVRPRWLGPAARWLPAVMTTRTAALSLAGVSALLALITAARWLAAP
ncbi:MAG: tetratricopeptide repeat protein [Pseudomonadota bacterium]|jgi:TPR repeat protein